MHSAEPPPPDTPAIRRGLLLLLALGLILRAWQYSADTALWLDEIAVARNVVERLPSLFLGLGAATALLFTHASRLHRLAGALVVALLIAGVIVPLVRVPPPYTIEDVKPVMAALNKAVGPETVIYAHANAAAAFEYYAPRLSLSDATYRTGSCRLADGRVLLEEFA